eukprot:Rhum_TRINITY_DN14385_c16_g1::Rhum_TRINITY_DN14385_c16_g1_i1::g.86141::m.86141
MGRGGGERRGVGWGGVGCVNLTCSSRGCGAACFLLRLCMEKREGNRPEERCGERKREKESEAKAATGREGGRQGKLRWCRRGRGKGKGKGGEGEGRCGCRCGIHIFIFIYNLCGMQSCIFFPYIFIYIFFLHGCFIALFLVCVWVLQRVGPELRRSLETLAGAVTRDVSSLAAGVAHLAGTVVVGRGRNVVVGERHATLLRALAADVPRLVARVADDGAAVAAASAVRPHALALASAPAFPGEVAVLAAVVAGSAVASLATVSVLHLVAVTSKVANLAAGVAGTPALLRAVPREVASEAAVEAGPVLTPALPRALRGQVARLTAVVAALLLLAVTRDVSPLAAVVAGAVVVGVRTARALLSQVSVHPTRVARHLCLPSLLLLLLLLPLRPAALTPAFQ